MGTLSTHVLDAARGVPAAGVAVRLHDGDGNDIATATTDSDGRHRFETNLPDGTYTLTFAIGRYFTDLGLECFHPQVPVVFTISGSGHYHVPLLASPFAYSTYRGS